MKNVIKMFRKFVKKRENKGPSAVSPNVRFDRGPRGFSTEQSTSREAWTA